MSTPARTAPQRIARLNHQINLWLRSTDSLADRYRLFARAISRQLHRVRIPSALYSVKRGIEAPPRKRRGQALNRRKASVPLVPPKPKELDNAARIFISRAWFGT